MYNTLMFDKEFVSKQRTALENLSRESDLKSEYLEKILKEMGLMYTNFAIPAPDSPHKTMSVYVVGLHCRADYTDGSQPKLIPSNFWDSIFYFIFDNDDKLTQFEEKPTQMETINQILAIGQYWGGFDGENTFFSML